MNLSRIFKNTEIQCRACWGALLIPHLGGTSRRLASQTQGVPGQPIYTERDPVSVLASKSNLYSPERQSYPIILLPLLSISQLSVIWNKPIWTMFSSPSYSQMWRPAWHTGFNYHLIDLKVTFIVQDFWLSKILKSTEQSKLWKCQLLGATRVLNLVLSNVFINDKQQ